MATRQYIGARYIPVFADPVEWDNANAYEYLTMVQHVGETYMSKQNVPIGAPLPDTDNGEESNEYWVHMSNWNAQVESYRQEVLQYNGRISTLEDDLPIADFNSTNTVKKAIDDNAALLPATDFDSTNTVKKAIDDNAALLPSTDFDSVNTVKKAIDDNAALLPSTDFDSVNTVKKAIDASMDAAVISQYAYNYIKPVIYGHFVYDSANGMQDHPGAICEKNSNEQIVISSTNAFDTTNSGHWRTISIQDNLDNWSSAVSRTLHHANSIANAVNQNRFIVAPVFDYSGGTEAVYNKLLSFNVNGTLIEEFNTPVNIMGVSYDHVIEKLYAFGYDGWVYEVAADNTMTQVINIGASNPFMQDFAVHDNMWYVSSPSGIIKCGSLITGETLYTATVEMDGDAYFQELDGMEFTSSGNLIAIGHTNFYGNNAMCVVFELPLPQVNTLYAPNKYMYLYQPNYSWDVKPSDAHLNDMVLKNLEELNVFHKRVGNAAFVEIKENLSIDTIYLTSMLQALSIAGGGHTITISSHFRTEVKNMTMTYGTFELPLPIDTNLSTFDFAMPGGTTLKSSSANSYMYSGFSSGCQASFGGFSNPDGIKLNSDSANAIDQYTIYLATTQFKNNSM